MRKRGDEQTKIRKMERMNVRFQGVGSRNEDKIVNTFFPPLQHHKRSFLPSSPYLSPSFFLYIFPKNHACHYLGTSLTFMQ